MARNFVFHALVFICILSSADKMAFANESNYSANFLGMVGLNTVPSARMDEAGTARIGASHADPHNHAFIGLQIAKPLYINLRQSMLVSSAGDKPSRVYPGMDIKLRIKKEGRYMPEIAFGMNSALGDKRFSSEYFALSKRWYDFDFTAGIAWGRLGSAGHIANPLGRISSHFKEDRDFSSPDAASPSNWFMGEQVGFFGGVEYFTPVKGLSLKADFNADAYTAETRQFDFKKPSPWSFGFNYSPKDWVSVGASLIGADKIMARLTFQNNIFNWGGRSYKEEKNNIDFGKIREYGQSKSAVIHLNDYQPAPMQIGRAARKILSKADPSIETISIIPVTNGIRGKTIDFSRRDLEQAIKGQGSPEEIWQDLNFYDDTRSISQKSERRRFKFHPELSLSLGEEETTHLYRASIVAEEQKQWKYGFFSGSSIRLNMANNLHRLQRFKDLSVRPIRSDIDLFARQRVNLDRAFLSWMKTPLPDFHLAMTAGFLEEMYAGYGGEILYRPFNSPFSIGAEAWEVYKRDYSMPLAAAFIPGDHHFTGHVNMFYDIPETDITAFAKAGKFIGGDIGVSTGAHTQFTNGVKAKAFVNVTSADNKDVFDSDRNVYAGIQLSLPLGSIKYAPEGSEARMKIEPIGRDDAALLDKPISLYDVTEPMSYRRLARNWQEVLN